MTTSPTTQEAGMTTHPQTVRETIARAIESVGEGCQSGAVYVKPAEAADAILSALSSAGMKVVKHNPMGFRRVVRAMADAAK